MHLSAFESIKACMVHQASTVFLLATAGHCVTFTDVCASAVKTTAAACPVAWLPCTDCCFLLPALLRGLAHLMQALAVLLLLRRRGKPPCSELLMRWLESSAMVSWQQAQPPLPSGKP